MMIDWHIPIASELAKPNEAKALGERALPGDTAAALARINGGPVVGAACRLGSGKNSAAIKILLSFCHCFSLLRVTGDNAMMNDEHRPTTSTARRRAPPDDEHQSVYAHLVRL